MPVTFGADTFSLDAPSGYVQESSQETTVETATIRDANGNTVIAIQKPRSTTTTNIKTKGGTATLLTVPTSGAFAGATCTSAKVGQTNDDFSTAEATYTLHQ